MKEWLIGQPESWTDFSRLSWITAVISAASAIPGVIMTAKALLNENPEPTEEEVREALSGNYCRCGTHYTAVESIMAYVESNKNKKEEQG